MHSCYEAGRDGFWLHRWLIAQGIDNLVVDSASIEVNRRARRAKTDRLDGDKLLSMLMRYHGGERRVWSVVRDPTPRAGRRAARAPGTGTPGAGAHRPQQSDPLAAGAAQFAGEVSWAGAGPAGGPRHARAAAPGLRAEIERESERLSLVKKQIRTIEAQQQRQAVAAGTTASRAARAARGIGMGSGWVLVKELFGWRRFRNRREVAGCLGLAPTPYASGDSESSKASPRPATRRLVVDGGARLELAALPAGTAN